jgi:hypothetical protein
MPTVADLPGKLKVSQFHKDRDPPHFHVWKAGTDTLITIADLAVLRGGLGGTDLDVVKMWARDHQAELALN